MTKAWSYSGVSEFLKFVKGLVAVALCLGTLGTTLALVDVAPASAAGTPTIVSISPISGLPAGGTKVTITGTNFSTTAANDVVDFGAGNPATISGTPTAGKLSLARPLRGRARSA